ncbi:MAG: response regulator [Hahellaceae bacterium]|nr:response regulator [Hahellaceae bacterium]
MNKKVLNENDSKNSWGASIAFLLLIIALESLLAVYWYIGLKPRLDKEAEANALLLAQTQAQTLAEVLSGPVGAPLDTHRLEITVDQILLMTDPVSKDNFFRGLTLEVEQNQDSEALFVRQWGETSCTPCYLASTEIYSRETGELIGIATFLVSNAFMKSFKGDVEHLFMLDAVITLMLLVVAWTFVNILITKLNNQIEVRKHVQRALLHAKEQAESANQAKSQFVANVSHEIRTPLNAILGLGYLLGRTTLSLQQSDFLKKINTSARALLNLINSVLDFSKMEAGKMTLHPQPLSVRELLNDIQLILAARAEEKGLQLKIQIDPAIPSVVKGDSFRLSQVLLNLVNNAIKFTSTGSVTLRANVHTEPQSTPNENHTDGLPDPQLADSANALILKFDIQDTGIGIQKNHLDQLFQAFAQIDNSHTRSQEGTGLGLVISKQIIELMGGQINVSSEPSVGSTFSFTCRVSSLDESSLAQPLESPATSALATRDHLPVPIQIPVLSGKVLLVEDNPTNQEVALYLLRDAGLECDLCNNGQQALNRLSEVAADYYQLVLMDVQMPGLDGLETTRRIRRLNPERHLPIIAMTASAIVGDKERCIEAGMNDCLTKPIDIARLYQTLAFWLPAAETSASTVACVDSDALDRLPLLPGIRISEIRTRFQTHPDLFLRLLARFASHHERFTERLELALKERDFSGAQQLVHYLRGESAHLGATALQNICAQLENELVTGQISDASIQQLTTLFKEVLRASAIAQEHLPSPAGSPEILPLARSEKNGEDAAILPAEPKKNAAFPDISLRVEKFEDTLSELETYLHRHSLKARHLIPELQHWKQLATLSDETRHQLDDLLEALQSLDFKQATMHLSALNSTLRLTTCGKATIANFRHDFEKKHHD